MKPLLALVFCALALSACDIQKGGQSLTAPGAVEAGSGGHALGSLSRVIGTWTGVQTPSCPECGEGPLPFTVVFKQSPADNLVIDADVRYVAQNGTVYHGTATGDLNTILLTINPAENPIGTLCGYRASGRLNAAGDRIEGSGEGFGPGPNCAHKRFSFYLTGQSQAACVGSGRLDFSPDPRNGYTLGNAMAIFPPGFVSPWLPFSLGVFDFAIPAGTWDETLETGHVTHPDVDQNHEQVRVPHYAAGSGALLAETTSDDVPTDRPTWITVRRITLTQPVAQIKVLHDYDGAPVSEPTHSVSILSLAYSCPVR